MTTTKEQIEILMHARKSPRRMYCGDSADMQALVAAGYMQSRGKVAWCPDEYFQLTELGLAALAKAGAA
jgi:hypothetical protein